MSKIYFAMTVIGNVEDWSDIHQFNIPYSDVIELQQKGEIEVIRHDLVIKISARELNTKTGELTNG